MRLLVLLQRMAFLCNLLFLVCVIIMYSQNFISSKELQSYIIILGFVVSFLLNVIVNIWEAILLLNRKKSATPAWLRTSAFIFFIVQIIFHAI